MFRLQVNTPALCRYLCMFIDHQQPVLEIFSLSTYVTLNYLSQKATHINERDSLWLGDFGSSYAHPTKGHVFLLVDLPKLRATHAARTKKFLPLNELNL